jgi:hypothetical protein
VDEQAECSARSLGGPVRTGRPRRTDGTSRRLLPREVPRPAGGARLLGNGGGRPGSCGRAACLPWPSGTRSWARRAGGRPPRRDGGSWEREMVAALPLGWAATAHPFVGRTPAAVPGLQWTGVGRPTTTASPASEAGPRCRAGAGRTGRLSRPDQARTIVRLGRFSTRLPSAADGDLGPRRRRDPTASCAGRPARGRRQLEMARRPLLRRARTARAPAVVRTTPAAGSRAWPAVSRLSPWWSWLSRTASIGPRSAGVIAGPVSFRELGPSRRCSGGPGGRRSDRSAAATAHLDQGRRAAGVGDAGCRHAPAPGACRALPSRACLTAHSRA